MFRMYHNLVPASAFLIMIGSSATAFYKQYLSYNAMPLILVQCQLGLYLPAWTPAWTLFVSLDASLDFICQPGRQLGLSYQPGP
jgi:hypothetical protein